MPKQGSLVWAANVGSVPILDMLVLGGLEDVDAHDLQVALVCACRKRHVDFALALIAALGDEALLGECGRMALDECSGGFLPAVSAAIEARTVALQRRHPEAPSTVPTADVGSASPSSAAAPMAAAAPVHLSPSVAAESAASPSSAALLTTSAAETNVASGKKAPGAAARIARRAPPSKPCKTLLDAIGSRSSAEAEAFILAGADVKTADRLGWTPLTHAINRSLESVALCAIDAGAPTTTESFITGDGQTLLMASSARGLLGVVRRLLEKGACVNAADARKVTSLMFACANAHAEVALALLAAGADVGCRDERGQSALGMLLGWSGAAEGRRMRLVVDALRARGATPTPADLGAQLFDAISARCIPAALRLIEEGADFSATDADGYDALTLAQKGPWEKASGLPVIVAALRARGAGAADRDSARLSAPPAMPLPTPVTPPSAAALHAALVRSIQQRDAKEALELIDAMRTLPDGHVDWGRRDDFSGHMLLHLACNATLAPVALRLVDSDSAAEKLDVSAAELLDLSIFHDRWPVLPPDASKHHEFSRRPLLSTVILRVLDLPSAPRDIVDIVAADGEGRTALHRASQGGLAAVVSKLLQLGHPVDLACAAGDTALDLAIRAENGDVVLALIAGGADVAKKNREGAVPLVACIQRLPRIFAALLPAALANCAIEFAGLLDAWIVAIKVAIGDGNTSDATTLLAATNLLPEDTKIDLSAQDDSGCTLFNRTVQRAGCVAIVCAMLDCPRLQLGLDFAETKGGWTALHHACRSGAVVVVAKLLKRAPLLADVATKAGLTALHVALSSKHDGVVRALVAGGADVSKKDPSGSTPLRASYSVPGLPEAMLSAVLARGAGCCSKDLLADWVQLVRWAVFEKDSAMALRFLDCASSLPNGTCLDLSVTDSMGFTVLHVAVVYGLVPVASRMLELPRVLLGIDVANAGGQTVLTAAMRRKMEPIVQRLVEKGALAAPLAKCSAEGFSWLITVEDAQLALAVLKAAAAAPGSQALLKKCDSAGYTPLHLCLKIPLEPLVFHLLETATAEQLDLDAPLHSDGFTALMTASYRGFPHIVSALVRKGANAKLTSRFRDTALDLAITRYQVPTIMALIKEGGVDLTRRNRWGKSLREACSAFPAVLAALSARGVTEAPAAPASSGTRGEVVDAPAVPAPLVAREVVIDAPVVPAPLGAREGGIGAPAVPAPLKARGGGVDAPPSPSVAPGAERVGHGARSPAVMRALGQQLIDAITVKDVDLSIKLINEHRAPLGVTNEKGNTPLTLACGHGLMPVALQLIASGADVNAANGDGVCALMWASKTGQAAVVRRLLEAGARVDARHKNGNTALHFAIGGAQSAGGGGAAGDDAMRCGVDSAHFETCSRLVQAGADLTLRGKDGLTPLELCKTSATPQLATELEILAHVVRNPRK